MTHVADFLASALADHLAVFGESASYDPAGATAARTISVIVTEVKPETEEGEYSEVGTEAVWVTALRNATTGINSPAMGDTLVLRGETTAPYAYQNEIRNRTTDSWTLLFSRRRMQTAGPGKTGMLGEGR